MIWWIISGTIFIGGAFVVFGADGQIWPAVNAAGIVSAVYLLAMIIYYTRKPVAKKTRSIFIVILLLAVGFTSYAWNRQYVMSHWQKNTLMEIRRVIGLGMFNSRIQQPLLEVLNAFYHGTNSENDDIVGLYDQMFVRDSAGAERIKYGTEEGAVVFLDLIGRDTVILTGQELYVKGIKQEFPNCNGGNGMMQVKAVLTKKGVSYEREN